MLDILALQNQFAHERRVLRARLDDLYSLGRVQRATTWGVGYSVSIHVVRIPVAFSSAWTWFAHHMAALAWLNRRCCHGADGPGHSDKHGSATLRDWRQIADALIERVRAIDREFRKASSSGIVSKQITDLSSQIIPTRHPPTAIQPSASSAHSKPQPTSTPSDSSPAPHPETSHFHRASGP